MHYTSKLKNKLVV